MFKVIPIIWDITTKRKVLGVTGGARAFVQLEFHQGPELIGYIGMIGCLSGLVMMGCPLILSYRLKP